MPIARRARRLLKVVSDRGEKGIDEMVAARVAADLPRPSMSGSLGDQGIIARLGSITA